MSRPGGCPSTGMSRFSCSQIRILKNISKSIPSLNRRISAQLRILKKKIRPCCSPVYRNALLQKIKWMHSLLSVSTLKKSASVFLLERCIKHKFVYIFTMKKLENIVQKVKDTSRKGLERVLASGIIAVGCLVGGSYGGEIEFRNRGPLQPGSSVYIKHINDSLEGDDGEDSYYQNSSNPLQIYSVNNNCDPNKLLCDARGVNSTSDYNLFLSNNGFSGLINNTLGIYMIDSNDFEWKNIFLGDENDSNNIVLDIINFVYSSGKKPLKEGILMITMIWAL